MSELIIRREPVAERLGSPLIEFAGVEKVYRTGKVEFRALRGVVAVGSTPMREPCTTVSRTRREGGRFPLSRKPLQIRR